MNGAEGVSIIIPIYNAEKYLDRCIHSAIKQTYCNIEIILVDDGSTDSSPDICRKFLKNDARVNYIRQENGGPGIARNVGVQAAKFEYVTFLDADDWLEDTFVEKVFYKMLAANSLLGICDICYVDYIEKTKRAVKIRFNSDVVSAWEDKTVLNKARLFIWGKVYHKALFLDNQLAFQSGAYEDTVVPVLIALANKIAYVPETLINYNRNRTGSLCNDVKNIGDIQTGLETLFETFHDFHLFDEYMLELKKIALAQYRFACRKWGNSDASNIQNILNQVERYIGHVFPTLQGVARKKFYCGENHVLAQSLDTAIPFAEQITSKRREADVIVGYGCAENAFPSAVQTIILPNDNDEADEEVLKYNLAEIIMEQL